MKQKQFEIFLSAFFSDKKKIDELVVSKNDLEIQFQIPGIYSGTIEYKFTVLDILQMNLDSWHSIKDYDELESAKHICPKLFYQDTLDCIDIILRKFHDLHYDGVEYDKYINLILNYDDDEDWFDKNEMKEYEAEGYRRIDLDLINYGVRRNVNKVIELLDNGANPMIDPDDKTNESEILDILVSRDSLSFISIVACHEQKINEGYESFDLTELEYLISQLYATASSAKLYDIINERQKERITKRN